MESRYLWLRAALNSMGAETGYWLDGLFYPRSELSETEKKEFEANPNAVFGLAEKYYL